MTGKRTICALAFLLSLSATSSARDPDGRYANSPLKPWFDQLASKKGLCCSFADGVKVEDLDYGTEAVAAGDETQIRYWVKIDGQKLSVPPEALITAPNKFGPAVAWPYRDADGVTQIRCFMPGAGA